MRVMEAETDPNEIGEHIATRFTGNETGLRGAMMATWKLFYELQLWTRLCFPRMRATKAEAERLDEEIRTWDRERYAQIQRELEAFNKEAAERIARMRSEDDGPRRERRANRNEHGNPSQPIPPKSEPSRDATISSATSKGRWISGAALSAILGLLATAAILKRGRKPGAAS